MLRSSESWDSAIGASSRKPSPFHEPAFPGYKRSRSRSADLFTQVPRRRVLETSPCEILGTSGRACYLEDLPKLGLAVSQKRITPRSGSTSETPTKCHSWLSPASRASWICYLMLPLWSCISSWAKYSPWYCSVTSRPSTCQPYEGRAALLSRSSVALPRARTQPTTRAPLP